MALGGKVDDVVEIVLCKQALHQLLVADVALHEHMAGVALHVLQVFQIARVGQLIQIDQQDLRVFFEHIVHKVGTDKTGTAGDQIGFHRSVSLFIYLLLFPDCGRAAARARSSSAQQCFATR